MNLPTINPRRGGHREAAARSAVPDSRLDEHMEASRLAQRQADKWLISGSLLIGTAALASSAFRCSSAGSGCFEGLSATA